MLRVPSLQLNRGMLDPEAVVEVPAHLREEGIIRGIQSTKESLWVKFK